MFKAMADPVRRAIVEDLAARNDRTLFDICVHLITERNLAMSRQAVSKHIAMLRDAGLVTVTTVGRTTVHHLDTDVLSEARRWIETIQGESP